MSQPCLPVSRRRKRDGNSPIDFDVSNLDASEYLSRVVAEAERLPENFEGSPSKDASGTRTKAAFQTGSAASLEYLLSDRAALHPAPSAQHLPTSPDWVDDTIDSFSKLREYIENCKSHGIGGKETDRLPLPPLKERDSWLIFCVGEAQAQGNGGGYFDDNDDEHDDDESSIPDPAWKVSLPPEGNAPSVRLVSQMDQIMVRKVLGHLAYFIHHDWDPNVLASWIYALLAALEKPIHREDAARLYSLLRKLTTIRASLEADSKAIPSINVLITVLTVYFEQGSGTLMKLPE